jgi:hypothetical protein
MNESHQLRMPPLERVSGFSHKRVALTPARYRRLYLLFPFINLVGVIIRLRPQSIGCVLPLA